MDAMSNSVKLTSGRCYLRKLTKNDVGNEYLKWVHDPEVVQYLEIKYNNFTLDDLFRYVASFDGDNTKFLFGIFLAENNEYIGNATVYNVNYNTGTFDLGYFVGKKEYWGKGIGVDVCLLLLKFAFEILEMRKFFAGVYSNNFSSRLTFKKIGCTEEATMKERFLFDNQPIDEIIYSLDKRQWDQVKKTFGI